MADNDNLYFSFDDEEDEDVEAEESQNRAFLIGAIILAAVFVLGICAIVIFFVIRPSNLLGGGGGVSDIELTNSANMTLAAATQTAAFEAQQATEEVTEEPTEVAERLAQLAVPAAREAWTGGRSPAESPVFGLYLALPEGASAEAVAPAVIQDLGGRPAAVESFPLGRAALFPVR